MACELAATVMSGRGGETPCPTLWALCVFFENYIDLGAEATSEDFGPGGGPSATVLKLIRGGKYKLKPTP